MRSVPAREPSSPAARTSAHLTCRALVGNEAGLRVWIAHCQSLSTSRATPHTWPHVATKSGREPCANWFGRGTRGDVRPIFYRRPKASATSRRGRNRDCIHHDLRQSPTNRPKDGEPTCRRGSGRWWCDLRKRALTGVIAVSRTMRHFAMHSVVCRA